MAPPQDNDFMPLFSAHEDRLQRLEIDRSRLAALEVNQLRVEQRVGGMEGEIKDLAKTSKEIHKILIELSTSMRFFSEKLEDVSNHTTSKHSDLETALKSVVSENKTQSDEIKDLKRGEAKAEKAFDWKMKFLFGTGAAAGGAILSLVAEYLKKKFGG